MGRHLKHDEITGIMHDIAAGKSEVEIMCSWDISYSSMRRCLVAARLVKKRATFEEIRKAVATYVISSTIAEWVTEEIDRIKREEEEKASVAENAMVALENEAVDSARRVLNPDEIIYSLMRIEELLGKLLVCWGGEDVGKV